jgi:cytochrome c biogenesis protein CcmG/thiol:disulfide interchange protein DsbE
MLLHTTSQSVSDHQLRTPGLILAVIVTISSAMLANGCRASSTPESKNAAVSTGTQIAAPRPLAQLYRRADQLLGADDDAFNHQISRLKGFPVVVNKWASWCGPCREEFPIFAAVARKHSKQLAFLGINTADQPHDAAKFLKGFPVGYPSYRDPKEAIARELGVSAIFPATVFFDRQGQVTFRRQGGYESEEALQTDIERYASN